MEYFGGTDMFTVIGFVLCGGRLTLARSAQGQRIFEVGHYLIALLLRGD